MHPEEEFGRLRANYVELDPHFTAYVVGLVAWDLLHVHLHVEGVEEGQLQQAPLHSPGCHSNTPGPLWPNFSDGFIEHWRAIQREPEIKRERQC